MVIFNKDDQHSLIIAECTLSDTGKYKLIASNDLGSAVTECQLNINPLEKNIAPEDDDEQEAGDPPIFLKPLTNLKSTAGSDVCLHCEIRSRSPYELKWYKDDKPLQETDNITVSFEFYFSFVFCFLFGTVFLSECVLF